MSTQSRQAPHPHLSRFFEFTAELNKETERGSALVCASMLDELLERILRSFLADNNGAKFLLSGQNPPLGTLASRNAAAFALGLITDREHAECSTIRKIRNEFAHQIGVSFSSPNVMKLCAKLTYGAKPYDEVTISARGTFVTAAAGLILDLTNRPHYVGRKRLSYGNWPR